jgi:hypothetical protein
VFSDDDGFVLQKVASMMEVRQSFIFLVVDFNLVLTLYILLCMNNQSME